MSNNKFELRQYKGTITVVTGLHIGAGSSELEIGGVDNQVVKDKLTELPYIPGSSLKGKIRALLELDSGLLPYQFKSKDEKEREKPLSHKTIEKAKESGAPEENIKKGEAILKLFGVSGDVTDSEELAEKYGITRASFADCFLNEEYLEQLKSQGKEPKTDVIEIKTETAINRLTGTATNPRQTERVVRGAKFDFTVTVKFLAQDSEEDREFMEQTLLRGFKLLTLDALGGCGSRGYGRVKIEFTSPEGVQKKFEELKL